MVKDLIEHLTDIRGAAALPVGTRIPEIPKWKRHERILWQERHRGTNGTLRYEKTKERIQEDSSVSAQIVRENEEDIMSSEHCWRTCHIPITKVVNPVRICGKGKDFW